MENQDLDAMIERSIDWPAIQATARQHGQAYIGVEDALKAEWAANQEDLEQALERVAERHGMVAVISGLDGNYPGEWFFASVQFEDNVVDRGRALIATTLDPAFRPSYQHDGERLKWLAAMTMEQLQAMARRLNVAKPDSELWTRYGLAMEIMLKEDAFPYHCWELTASHQIILSTVAPIHTDMVNYTRCIGEATIGHQWALVKDHVAALNNVASWRGEVGWTYRLIGITDGFCDDRLTKELDEVPF